MNDIGLRILIALTSIWFFYLNLRIGTNCIDRYYHDDVDWALWPTMAIHSMSITLLLLVPLFLCSYVDTENLPKLNLGLLTADSLLYLFIIGDRQKRGYQSLVWSIVLVITNLIYYQYA